MIGAGKRQKGDNASQNRVDFRGGNSQKSSRVICLAPGVSKISTTSIEITTSTLHGPKTASTSDEPTTKSILREKITAICPPPSDGLKNPLTIYLPIICILIAIIIGIAIYIKKNIKLVYEMLTSNSHESHMADFKNEVNNRPLRVNGQNETDGYLTPIAIPENTIESADGYLIPKSGEDRDQCKHHVGL
ncbi:hypothetical protein CHUAL_010517 [Chamberlinius hualienensis]